MMNITWKFYQNPLNIHLSSEMLGWDQDDNVTPALTVYVPNLWINKLLLYFGWCILLIPPNFWFIYDVPCNVTAAMK